MKYKQPRSIQVVVFANEGSSREYLLLRRVASHGGFWQSVTGSLEEGESHSEAAIRELREETGFALTEDRLVDLNLVNRFEIAPQWRPYYAPGVTHNDEVCFAVRVSVRKVRLDFREHDAYIWADYAKALDLLYWESSKLALAATADL
jgi:dATP pyrophosphohydrolase